MYDLIVVGGGPGGYEAAIHAGKMGKKVALIEKERLGGTCLNVGCIPAKTFLRSSRLFRECREAAAYGVRVGAPEFDMPTVVERKNRIVATLSKGVQGLLKRAGVEVIPATHAWFHATPLKWEARVTKQRIFFWPLVHASGAADPGNPVGTHPRFQFRLRVAASAQTIAIVGGGYIGLEFACFFQEIGTRVERVRDAAQYRGWRGRRNLGPHASNPGTQKGIEFHLSAKVLRIEGHTLHFATQEGKQSSVDADYILNSTGRVPVVDGLGLEEVGLDFSPKGIKTSDQGKTNIPGIWACGDVTGRRMLAHAATREGIVAVNNMFGRKDRVRYNALPAVVYTHPEAAMVGSTEEELKNAGIKYKKSVVPMAVAGRFLIEHEDGTGLVKILCGAEFGEILGVHAIGDGCSEFIVAAAAMVETEMCVADASEIVFPHPTVSESLKEAIAGVH